ncbi:MAG: A/G-specific adenine glycosylase [Kiritimatiellia bacterium]
MTSELKPLITWYRRAKRPMPWRLKVEPYACWLSEIMLQQTTYEQALPYYTRFRARFPDVHALAAADEQDVLKAWEGLGYYARARNLLKAARQFATTGWPTTLADWRAVPGVGPYTAAALASVLDGVEVCVVDGNVARVFARYWKLTDDFRKLPPREQLAERLRPLMCARPGDFNQAMMELGALICTPKSPRCGDCPLRTRCLAAADGTPEAYPVRKARKTPPVRRQQVVIVTSGDGKVLLVRRRADGLLGGLWDLPSVEPAGEHVQTFSHFKLELSLLRATTEAAFVNPREVPLTTAARKVLQNIAV